MYETQTAGSDLWRGNFLGSCGAGGENMLAGEKTTAPRQKCTRVCACASRERGRESDFIFAE